MADLYVTFGKSYPGQPHTNQASLRHGSSARTEVLEIDTTTAEATSTNSANAGEDIVDLVAGAACWVTIGASPVAVNQEGWHLAANERLVLGVDEGDKVSVIEAT